MKQNKFFVQRIIFYYSFNNIKKDNYMEQRYKYFKNFYFKIKSYCCCNNQKNYLGIRNFLSRFIIINNNISEITKQVFNGLTPNKFTSNNIMGSKTARTAKYEKNLPLNCLPGGSSHRTKLNIVIIFCKKHNQPHQGVQITPNSNVKLPLPQFISAFF